MHVCVDGATQKMKKSIWIVGLLGWVMVLFSGMWQQSAQAAGEGFTVKAELPENQRGTSASYFDLRVSPNQAQPLLVSKLFPQNDLFCLFRSCPCICSCKSLMSSS